MGESQSDTGLLNDLCEFKSSINEWAWMGGSDTANRPQTWHNNSIPTPIREREKLVSESPLGSACVSCTASFDCFTSRILFSKC